MCTAAFVTHCIFTYLINLAAVKFWILFSWGSLRKYHSDCKETPSFKQLLKPVIAKLYTVFQKSDAKIQITITTVYCIRIKYPVIGFKYRLSDVNVANFNEIYCTVSQGFLGFNGFY